MKHRYDIEKKYYINWSFWCVIIITENQLKCYPHIVKQQICFWLEFTYKYTTDRCLAPAHTVYKACVSCTQLNSKVYGLDLILNPHIDIRFVSMQIHLVSKVGHWIARMKSADTKKGLLIQISVIPYRYFRNRWVPNSVSQYLKYIVGWCTTALKGIFSFRVIMPALFLQWTAI